MTLMSSRNQILGLLHGDRSTSPPTFGALSTIIAPALDARGLAFHEIHRDPVKMVAAAASAYELYGLPSATLPSDLVLEAEAMGARVDFRDDMPIPMWPIVPEPLFDSPAEIVIPPGDFTRRGRIPLVLDALRRLKQRVGNEIVVGAWIAGPFTVANYLVDYQSLMPAVRMSPDQVAHALDVITEALLGVVAAYQQAGADFVTIHEMGGSPGVLGPRVFGDLVLGRLQTLIHAISAPTILSVCGNTNQAMELLAESGATALAVEHTNNLTRSRQLIGDRMLLFGNLDPVGLIANGTVEQVRAGKQAAIQAGVDAVMPGCDLYLETPEENMRELVGSDDGSDPPAAPLFDR